MGEKKDVNGNVSVKIEAKSDVEKAHSLIRVALQNDTTDFERGKLLVKAKNLLEDEMSYSGQTPNV